MIVSLFPVNAIWVNSYQLATPGFVGGHMAVYPLVTHHEAYLLAHRAYLLRAPPPGECQLDKLDDIGR